MKNFKKIGVLILIGVFLSTAAGCKMIVKTSAGIRRQVVAKGNDIKITKGQVDDLMKSADKQFKAQYGSDYMNNSDVKSQYVNYQKQIRTQLENSRIIEIEAAKLKVAPSDKALKSEIDKKYSLAVKSAGSEKDFKSMLALQGYTADLYKESLKTSILSDKLKDYLVKNVKITDSDMKKYYDANKQAKYTEKPDRIKVSHILTTSESDANKVYTALTTDKQDFAAVSHKYSIDKTADANGGDLGYFYYDQDLNQQSNNALDNTFFTAALSLKVNEISKPVQTQYGWHVIKCTDRQEYPYKSYDSVKDDVKNTLLNDKKTSLFQSKLEAWKTQLGVKEYDNNL